ncbi:MAG: hypothetical protein QW548_02310 [Candidatus Aenigmatarchaeota archaeon]
MPELVAHVIALSLGIAAIATMAAILNAIRTDSNEGSAQALSENVCAQIKIAAEQLQPGAQSSVIHLALPRKIGGEPYDIRANNHVISVVSASTNHSCVAGTAAQLAGNISGGAIRLTLLGDTIKLTA